MGVAINPVQIPSLALFLGQTLDSELVTLVRTLVSCYAQSLAAVVAVIRDVVWRLDALC